MDRDDLRKLLVALYADQDRHLRDNYNRSLPFQDGLVDRWERAKQLGFSEGTSIYNSALVFGRVSVDKHTWVGPNVILDGSGADLCVGTYCCISAGSLLYTHDTVRWALSGGVAPKKFGPVSIGDCCYLGSNCVVIPNVTIGAQCVVSANSLVTKSFPPRTVAGGNPARVLGKVIGDGSEIEIAWD